MKVRPLNRGDKVGIFAPGGACDPRRYLQGVRNLEEMGYCPRAPQDPCINYGISSEGFASASAAKRLCAIGELLADPQVAMLIAARGAYGTTQLLGQLDFSLFASAGKCVVGSSDVTALLGAVYLKTGLHVVHGPTLSGDFARSSEDEAAKNNVEELVRLLSDPEWRLSRQCEVLREGRGRGPVIAGNLTMLVELLGTPWDLNYDGAVLVLEDVGEAPYRVHRALVHLRNAGKLQLLSALVYGTFSRCEAPHGLTVAEVIRGSVNDILFDTHFPVLCGFEFGHEGVSHPLPFGCLAEVISGEFRMLESPIA